MPDNSGSSFELCNILASIWWVIFTNKSSFESKSISVLSNTESSSTKLLIAIAEATSPPACPPIPSATAIKFSLINAESSLPSRTKPRSVCAKELNCQVIEPISPHIWVNDIYSVYVGNKWGEK